MLKSPEEYLSALSFEPPEGSSRELSSGEKIFIEKYIGLEAYERLPEVYPEREAETALPPELELPPEMLEEPEITPPQAPAAEEIPQLPVESAASEVGPEEPELLPQKLIISPPAATLLKEDIPAAITLETAPPGPVPADAAELLEIGEVDIEPEVETAPAPILEVESQEEKAGLDIAPVLDPIRPEPLEITAQEPVPAPEIEAAREKAAVPLKETLKNEAEIQMVSFFTAGQLFLLPVLSIQEVLRHQELIKVPQAPEFVAGVINLRGHVMPVVRLSALLTNVKEHPYNERNFIIVCGTEQLKIGLIIDRINSMHVMPQNAIIWNAEAKLGEAAEFLCAIATLDEKVTGVIEPETIAQKILSP